MLWNLASNIGRSNYQVYHNAPPPSRVYTDPSGKTQYNITQDFSKPNEAKLSVDFGNMTCITIYNAEKFARWANRTIKHVEYQTKQAFPFGNFANLQNGSATGQIQFNFTMEPGRIIHNETISVTCCGTDHLALDFEEILSGKDPHANCVHLAAKVPFREIKVIPSNVTINITEKDIEKLVNETIANTTEINNSTTNTNVTEINTSTTNANTNATAANEPVTMAVLQAVPTTVPTTNSTTVENKNENSTQPVVSDSITTTPAAVTTTT